jgi:hypothetical protein
VGQFHPAATGQAGGIACKNLEHRGAGFTVKTRSGQPFPRQMAVRPSSPPENEKDANKIPPGVKVRVLLEQAGNLTAYSSDRSPPRGRILRWQRDARIRLACLRVETNWHVDKLN